METKYVCQNCDGIFKARELKEITDIFERVDPGEVMPAGECPNCGALCHNEAPIFVTMDGGIVQDVINLPAGTAYEVIDWEWLKEDTHDAWGPLSDEAKAYIRTQKDEWDDIRRKLRRKPRTRKAA